MLKPVTILALDDDAATLAEAVVRRVSAVEDLVQWRRAEAVADAIKSTHAQRQRSDSPLRTHDDISGRELVLVIVSASGTARTTLLETLADIRTIYETRRLATFVSIEVLCLLPEVTGAMDDGDHAAAYAILKALSGADPKPFDAAWLLDATNDARVTFGTLADSLDAYADAVAGALTFEPEMSGALPGHHPRGMPPAFSSFGCAELLFPREEALRRLEMRFTAQLFGTLCDSAIRPASLAAKEFVVSDAFATPLARIGGEALFRRFHPKTAVGEKTRSAEEVIAGARAELQQHRDSVHLASLRAIEERRETATSAATSLLTYKIDETLDRDGYATAIAFAEALIDPLPDLRDDASLAPRNLATEIRTAAAALDARIRFTPNVTASEAARKRVRELTTLLQEQKVVAETVAAPAAAEQLAELERERASLLETLPDTLFAEEGENNAARNAARDAEVTRLASESEAKEQQLRELFAQKPRAEHGLREALEARRAWLWRKVFFAIGGVLAIVAVAYAFDLLRSHPREVTKVCAGYVIVLAAVAAFRYATVIAPRVRDARDALARLVAQIEATDKAKNAAYDAELQFEHDVAVRRATLSVLAAAHETAKQRCAALRARRDALAGFVSAPLPRLPSDSGLTIRIVDEAELDAWYERTMDDRTTLLRDFPIGRAASFHMSADDLRMRVTAYSASAFAAFRAFSAATAATTVANGATLARRLKRLAELAAPLIELRDDDLEAQKAMQRDTTFWVDESDARWVRQLRDRFPEAQVKTADDPLRVHVMTRALHYPAYVIGQIDFMRSQYDSAPSGCLDAFPDLLPPDLALNGTLRATYEQVLLCHAVGINTSDLGDTTLTAAKRLAASDAAALRRTIADALTPRLTVASEVTRGLRSLLDGGSLTPLDRGLIESMVKRYEAI